MQVQLETLGNLERRLDIALPLTDIDAEVQKRLARVARTAKIAGFRPGKAPLKMVERNYGASVREDVLGEQVQLGFSKAVAEQKLRVAGYPRFEPAADNDPAALVTLKAMLRDPADPAHGRAFEDSFGSARFRAGTQRYR